MGIIIHYDPCKKMSVSDQQLWIISHYEMLYNVLWLVLFSIMIFLRVYNYNYTEHYNVLKTWAS